MAGCDWGGDGAGDGKPVARDTPVLGYVPWIFAEADPDAGWWERQRSNPKRMGELSQAAFLVKAQSLGFGLALPWGDSEKYDFIVWARPQGRLLRVQVKATGRLNCGGYDVQPVYSTRGEGKKTYTAEDIDVLAAHVVVGIGGKEVWYLLPVGAFAEVKSLRFFPDLKSRNPRWEGYREQWSVLSGR
ncbi:MAG: group I intron-associated PD-(D/E)XK endonuclease [Candidatus Sulfotelmatobacter sp.]